MLYFLFYLSITEFVLKVFTYVRRHYLCMFVCLFNYSHTVQPRTFNFWQIIHHVTIYKKKIKYIYCSIPELLPFYIFSLGVSINWKSNYTNTNARRKLILFACNLSKKIFDKKLPEVCYACCMFVCPEWRLLLQLCN